jgi:hypothetical protein
MPHPDPHRHEIVVFRPFRQIVTVHGLKVRFGPVMQRLFYGEWQYRLKTDEECAEDQAW